MQKNKSKILIKELTYCALFVVLMTVGAFVKIPIPYIPITFQTTFAIMAGLILGAKLGALSVFVYMIMGLCGIPIFSGGGGFGYVLQPSFGYIIGFVLGSFVCGLVAQTIKNKKFLGHFVAGICGVIVVYLIGVPYLILILKLYMKSSMSIDKMVINYFVILFPKDIALVALASLLTVRLKPFVKIKNQNMLEGNKLEDDKIEK